MANVKLSQIAPGTTPAPTDTVIGVQSGTTDAQYTLAQIGASVLKIGNAVASGTPGSVLFIDGSGNLAQDNAQFFWDDANLRLKVGSVGTPTGEYWVNGVRALFGIPNVSGNNWFEAGAGNATLTGYLNFGTGDGCLAALTTGFNNVGLGAQSMLNLTSGTQNIGLGSRSMWFGQLDSNNVGIGNLALATLGIGGAGAGNNANNVAIGFGAFGNAQTGTGNVCLGSNSLSNIFGAADKNTIVGDFAGNSLGTSASGNIHNNTLIGSDCGSSIQNQSSNNTWIGRFNGNTTTAYDSSIVIADGRGGSGTAQVLDYGITSFANSPAGLSAWSFGYDFHWGQPSVVHLYNKQDSLTVATNYERAAFDWFTTTNVFRIRSQAGGTGVVRLIAIDGFSKAGAPANTDLPSGSFALIDDTTNNQTWLVFNKGGTIRKVQLT